MKLDEALARCKAGELLAIGEYRFSKSEMLNWVDKQNGRERSAPILRHTVELGDKSVVVNDRVSPNTKLEDIHVPFSKGQQVAVFVEEWVVSKGQVSCRGHLELIESTPSPAKSSAVAGGKGVAS